MALLTVMMVLLMLTVLGIAAITVTGVENNMAGLQRIIEASANAAESCLGTGANVIQQVYLPENGDQIPTALLDNSSPPGPVPNANKTVLENELIGHPENNTDQPTGAPNLVMPGGIGPYRVVGDIDFLYRKQKPGGSVKMFAGSDANGSNSTDLFFRITCVATNTATGTESRISAIYACSITEDGCQKQP